VRSMRAGARTPYRQTSRGTIGRRGESKETDMADIYTTERVNTVVIGGGQAGLSVGHHLARRGVDFVILDAHARVGDTWRNRWDSLRLFTMARFAGLDGLPFPAPGHSF